jgi:L,D-transpeptidase catalytic domain
MSPLLRASLRPRCSRQVQPKPSALVTFAVGRRDVGRVAAFGLNRAARRTGLGARRGDGLAANAVRQSHFARSRGRARRLGGGDLDEPRHGRHGYVRVENLRLTHTPVVLEVDLSQRLLRVWRSGDLRLTVRVAIGAAVSPTPTGRFAVTDELYDFNPAAYGCCILALSAHQARLAPGWPGGDRLAIHAGGGAGTATSNGCLKAARADMRWLMARVPLGTQIVIHPKTTAARTRASDAEEGLAKGRSSTRGRALVRSAPRRRRSRRCALSPRGGRPSRWGRPTSAYLRRRNAARSPLRRPPLT